MGRLGGGAGRILYRGRLRSRRGRLRYKRGRLRSKRGRLRSRHGWLRSRRRMGTTSCHAFTVLTLTGPHRQLAARQRAAAICLCPFARHAGARGLAPALRGLPGHCWHWGRMPGERGCERLPWQDLDICLCLPMLYLLFNACCTCLLRGSASTCLALTASVPQELMKQHLEPIVVKVVPLLADDVRHCCAYSAMGWGMAESC